MPLYLLLSTVVFWGLDYKYFFFCHEIEKRVFGDAKVENPSHSTQHECPAQGIAGMGVFPSDGALGDGCKAGLSLLAAMLLLLPLPG